MGEFNRFGVVGSLIPLKFLEKHHDRPVYCGHAIVGCFRDNTGESITRQNLPLCNTSIYIVVTFDLHKSLLYFFYLNQNSDIYKTCI